MSVEKKLVERVDELIKWVGSEHKQTCDRGIDFGPDSRTLSCTCGLKDLQEFLADLKEKADVRQGEG